MGERRARDLPREPSPMLAARMARLPLHGDTLPLVARLWRDWMRPHAGTLALVLVLVALVAGATGLYPS